MTQSKFRGDPSMKDVIIRKYHESDRIHLISLYKNDLSDNYSEEWFDWLYHHPFNPDTLILVAEYDDKIVGALGEIRKPIVYNERQFICGRHVDPVVDSSMRGKKVFSRLLRTIHEMSASYVDFYYCFPNSASLPGFLRNGYVQAGPFRTPTHQNQFLTVSMKEKIRFLRTGLKIIYAKNHTVEQADFKELENANFIVPKDKFVLNKSYNYLEWRYVDNPIKSYDLLISRRQNQKINAACVTQLQGKGRVSIMDLFQFDSNLNMSAFLVAIRDIFKARMVSVWDNGPEGISRYFYGNSWHNFLVREGKSSTHGNFYNMKHWFLTKGDVEGN